MDFKAPIDITAVLTAVKKHKNMLQAVDKLAASEVLQYMTPIPGVTDSLELGKVEGGTISSKYTGKFTAGKYLGKIVPRRIIVRPVVMEMSDEPERYRRSYLANVPGEIRKDHPFEVWIIKHGLELASEDLLYAMFIAKYNPSEEHNEITDSFDGIGTIINEGIISKDISASEGNVFETGEMSRANIGEKLLNMWRNMPLTFRRKDSIMYIADELGDMYDDWRKDEGTVLIGGTEETAATEFLLGTKKKCKLVRLPNLPDKSQLVILTTKGNLCYAYDKESDFRSLKPFISGNPYLFTAAGKYVIGFQFVSVHKSEFCVNDRPMNPVPGQNPWSYLKVNITPTEALPEGARWRIKGESIWRNSGEVAAVLPGTQTIEYSKAKGYQQLGNGSQLTTKGEMATVSAVFQPEE